MLINWQTKKLSEVVKIQNGFAFKSSDYVDSGFFVMRITNVQDGIIELNNPKYIREAKKTFGDFILKENDILMSLTGNVGRVGIIKKEHLPAVLNQRVARLQVSDESKLDRDFLFYFLRSPKFFDEVVSGGKGMAQQNVSTKDIGNLEILLPPLETQKEIVAKLDEKFAKLHEAKKLQEEALANTEKILSQTLREIFEEGKRKGWEEKELREICEIARGGSPRPIQSYLTESDNGINWIKISDATNSDKYIYKTKQKITKDGLHKTRMVYPGDFILTNSMSFGRPYIMKTEGAIHDGWLLLRPDKSISEEYLYYFLSSDDIYQQFKKLAGGAVVQNLNSVLIKNIKVLIPSIVEQQKIVKTLDELSEKIKSLRELQASQLADLKSLERAYLREAFNGEL